MKTQTLLLAIGMLAALAASSHAFRVTFGTPPSPIQQQHYYQRDPWSGVRNSGWNSGWNRARNSPWSNNQRSLQPFFFDPFYDSGFDELFDAVQFGAFHSPFLLDNKRVNGEESLNEQSVHDRCGGGGQVKNTAAGGKVEDNVGGVRQPQREQFESGFCYRCADQDRRAERRDVNENRDQVRQQQQQQQWEQQQKQQQYQQQLREQELKQQQLREQELKQQQPREQQLKQQQLREQQLKQQQLREQQLKQQQQQQLREQQLKQQQLREQQLKQQQLREQQLKQQQLREQQRKQQQEHQRQKQQQWEQQQWEQQQYRQTPTMPRNNVPAQRPVAFAELDVTGYRSDELDIWTEGNKVMVKGHHTCDCDDSCLVTEFQRTYAMPKGLDKKSVKAKYGRDGKLTLQGVAKRDNTLVQDKKVEIDYQGPPEAPRNNVQCQQKNAGIPLRKVNVAKKNIHDNIINEQDFVQQRAFEGEIEDDGVTIEIVE